jgi:phosphopantothenoylcysteine decarboxylase/phosphopantothenate--cysteine ligase
LDAIVLNDVMQQGAGFEVDTNQVTWVTQAAQEEWPMMPKHEVAERILERVALLLH